MPITAHHARVSIRAPAWGATQTHLQQRGGGEVSIRAPAWGATDSGGDDSSFFEVSIRAPAWGATPAVCMLRTVNDVSIRAPAWGATSVERLIADEEQFQFALPHGERLPSCNDRYSLHRKRTIR